MHLRNWVDDSSAPLVCTCQAKAALFPHLGHVTWMVGNTLSWFSLPITETNCLGLCSMTRLYILASLVSFSFCPHLVHARTSIIWFPDLTFLGASRAPHFEQKSIQPTPLLHVFCVISIGKLCNKRTCGCIEATTNLTVARWVNVSGVNANKHRIRLAM